MANKPVRSTNYNRENDKTRLKKIFVENRVNLIIKYVRLFLIAKRAERMQPKFIETVKLKKILPIDCGFSYYGNKIGNVKEGFGVVKFNDQTKVVGIFHNDKLNGMAKVKLPNDSVYSGEMKDSIADGFGEFKYIQGGVYTGDFKDDQPNGIGYEKWVDGSEYSGEYKDGKPNGIGMHKGSDGQKYFGVWKNGLFNDYGILMNDAMKYTGEFRLGEINGYGEIVYWKDYSVYVGDFVNGIKEGFGIFMRKKFNRVFVGYFKKNKIWGVGRMVSQNGEATLGVWKDNEIQKEFSDEKQFVEALNKMNCNRRHIEIMLKKYETFEVYINLVINK